MTASSPHCPICFETFDEQKVLARVFPCRGQHIFCTPCLNALAEQNANHELCLFRGRGCSYAIRHWMCSLCRDTVHIPEGGVSSLPAVPLSDLSLSDRGSSSIPLQDSCELLQARCPNCTTDFDPQQEKLVVFPCPSGHLVCHQCLEKSINRKRQHTECVLFGKSCDQKLQHAACPTCWQVTHLPRDGLPILVSRPISQDDLKKCRQEVLDKKHNLEIQFKAVYSSISSMGNRRSVDHEHSTSRIKQLGANAKNMFVVLKQGVKDMFSADDVDATKQKIKEINQLKIDICDLLRFYQHSSIIAESLAEIFSTQPEGGVEFSALAVDTLIGRMANGISNSRSGLHNAGSLAGAHLLTNERRVRLNEDLNQLSDHFQKDDNRYLDNLDELIRHVDRCNRRLVQH